MITKRNVKSRRGFLGRLGYGFFWCAALVVSRIALAGTPPDPEESKVPPEIANQPPDYRSAHVHNADMSCCKPCSPTEADRDPDIFKRPCFVRAIGKSREFAPVFGLTRGGAGGIKLPQESIPVAYLQGFQALLTAVLQPDFLAASWQSVEFDARVSCPLKTISEIRNGVKTFVRQEYDCSEQVTKLEAGGAIQTAWRAGRIDVLPYLQYQIEPPRSAQIRLRLHGDERLELFPRPPEFRPGGDRMREQWDFFDPRVFHELFTKVFGVPFEKPDDYFIRG
ncbi:MAG: hypothetical protein JSU86_08195, partial [Phycisphaerales bacterium]